MWDFFRNIYYYYYRANYPLTCCTLTTLLAQAIKFALHFIFVIEPSPSWRTVIFHRFSQFLSYRSSCKGGKMSKTFNTVHLQLAGTEEQGCSCAAWPTEGSRWIAHCTGAVIGFQKIHPLDLTEIVGNALIHASDDRLKTQLHFSDEHLNSTSKHLGTETMKTNCSLHSI